MIVYTCAATHVRARLYVCWSGEPFFQPYTTFTLKCVHTHTHFAFKFLIVVVVVVFEFSISLYQLAS